MAMTKPKKKKPTKAEMPNIGMGLVAEPADAAKLQQDAAKCLPKGDIAENTPLTYKQELFIRYYLVHLNQTRAAIEAGYTPENARNHAARLLSNAYIRRKIQDHMDERVATIGIDGKMVLTRIVQELNADTSDLIADDGTLKKMKDWPIVWRRGLVSGIDLEEIWEGTGEDRTQTGVVKKIKLSSRIKQLELLGRHTTVQAFSTKVPLPTPNAQQESKTILEQLAGNVITPKTDGMDEDD